MKRVKVTKCTNTLPFIQAIRDICAQKIESAANIVRSLTSESGEGVMLIGEGEFITVEQWELVASRCATILEWEYIQNKNINNLILSKNGKETSNK